MAKAKKRVQPAAKRRARATPANRDRTATADELGAWALPENEADNQQSSVSWEDRQLLGTAIRFLYTVVDPRFLRRAMRAGYSREEHEELWAIFDRAAGRERGLEHAATASESDPERKRLLVEIDEFENTWFPRIDKIIRRRVPETSVDAVLSAFFADLAQQPLGPAVLNSVSTLLDRFEQLETSKLPGAATVFATVQRRGLTAAKVREVREKIALLRGAPSPGGSAAPARGAEGARAAAEAQRVALRELRLAWNDWSTTLRPLYDIREQIQLGLTEARGAAPSGPSGPSGPPPAPSGPPAG